MDNAQRFLEHIDRIDRLGIAPPFETLLALEAAARAADALGVTVSFYLHAKGPTTLVDLTEVPARLRLQLEPVLSEISEQARALALADEEPFAYVVYSAFREPDVRAKFQSPPNIVEWEWGIWYGPEGASGDHATTVEEDSEGYTVKQYDRIEDDEFYDTAPFRVMRHYVPKYPRLKGVLGIREAARVAREEGSSVDEEDAEYLPTALDMM